MADQKETQLDADELRMLLSGGPVMGAPPVVDEEERQTFIERRLAQREAYGQFRATAPIYAPGTTTLVFNMHQAVPLEHVEMWDLERAGLVVRVANDRDARAGRFTPSLARKAGYQVEGDDDPTAGPTGSDSGASDSDSASARKSSGAKNSK